MPRPAGNKTIVSILDCSPLLTRQLAELAALVTRLQACTGEQEAARLFRNLSDRAVLHVLSRERVLLPAWRRARWKDLPLDAMAAHVSFKRALAELMVRRPASQGFASALATFAARLEHLQSMDHGRVIPILRDVMDVHQRRDLCNDIELLFETSGPPARDGQASERTPRELVQEAEIVLSSLSPGVPPVRPSSP